MFEKCSKNKHTYKHISTSFQKITQTGTDVHFARNERQTFLRQTKHFIHRRRQQPDSSLFTGIAESLPESQVKFDALSQLLNAEHIDR